MLSLGCGSEKTKNDFADFVSFSIGYKQVELTTTYKLIKSWIGLSDATEALHEILKRKVHLLKQSVIK